ncbi:MAG: VOC family protein [Salana multivorans]|uniref:VOC family protein n=1 Tax=Salana multivorans TaxID=120377 RepID=UPI00095F1ACD|nr:VOC family protein [Salana multivorans]MBN8882948.1 VOC family protein [Salana multivorans]OJX95317.1 MAG: lyase [Micrococcales bacterium 73-15]
MTTISLLYCPITVDDVDAAIAFYRDALGLELTNDVASDGHRWVTLGSSDPNAPALVLSDPGAGRSPEDGDALHRLVAKGSGPGPYVFFTDDLDAVFERARDAGAEVLQEPMSQPWGTRDVALRDPAGNLVRINQAR